MSYLMAAPERIATAAADAAGINSLMRAANSAASTAGTAVITWSKSANGATTVALWSRRGYSLTITSVASARVPSEPTMSWVRS